MKKRIWGMSFLFFVVCLAAQAADSIDHIDSLLSVYAKAKGKERLASAREIVALSAENDELFSLPLTLREEMPGDSLDLAVWFAAERFYFINAYFEESLSQIDRALPLTEGISTSAPHQEMRATLLCDRGYCCVKTGRNEEAVDTEMQAKEYAKKHGLMLSLARSYNYLAIIDLVLGNFDDAKHFVARAIETDRQTGSDLNTHNYLGIACEVYSWANEPEKAVEYGQQAVDAARKIGYDAGVVNHLSQLSYAYNRQGNLDKALEMSMEAVKTVEAMPTVDRNLLAISLEYVALNLLDMHRNAEAVAPIRRAIALQQELGNYRSVCYDHKSLAEALEPDNPREAMAALRRYSVMMDSLHYDEMHAVLGKANAQLHNDELKEANDQGRREKRTILISGIVLALMLLAVIGALVYAGRTRSRSIHTMRQLQTVRENFFTNVAHEFRTPLTVILGVSRQLMKKSEGDDADALKAVERNGEQLLTLVNQLLDISKVKSAIGTARWQKGDLLPLLTMQAESFSEMAAEKGVRVRFLHEQPSIDATFVPDYLTMVVGNLLSNAVKNTPEGGEVTMTATTRQNARSKSSDQLLLTISDTGKGINPADLPHIFEPFYQGSSGTSTQGTGIGLTLVHQIIESLGGTITAKSTPSNGTTFNIAVPLHPDVAPKLLLQETPTQESPLLVETPRGASPHSTENTLLDSTTLSAAHISLDSTATSETEVRGNDLLVLIVEDNADVARYIGSCLSDRYNLVYASNGQEGMEKARQLVPDIIVTDLMMPDMDGLEMCRRLRAELITDHIPIIVVTAKATGQDRIRGIEAGADAYLYKPFDAEELTVRVEKLLEQRHRLYEKWHTAGELSESSEYSEYSESSEYSEYSETSDTSASASSSVSAASRPPFLDKLDAVILEHMPKGEVDAQTIATALAMSLSQFSRKLKAITGTTPAAYILNMRMNEAKQLLAQFPTHTIGEIALRCGFADSAHFSHAFRREMGITPSQYVKSLELMVESV